MSKKKPTGELEPQKASAGGKRVMSGFDQYYDEAVEPGKRERAYAWATAIGLQQVDGLTPSEYLIRTAQRNIEGEITGDEARRLIDEYYEAKKQNDVESDAANVVVNDVVKLSEVEEKAIRALLRDTRLSATRLAAILGVKPRQAQRIIASLKIKAELKRRGADKNGEWYFEECKM